MSLVREAAINYQVISKYTVTSLEECYETKADVTCQGGICDKVGVGSEHAGWEQGNFL